MVNFKKAAGRMAASLPLPILMRLRKIQPETLTILCYHTLSGDENGPDVWTAIRKGDFREQIEFLKDFFEIVALDDALDLLKGSNSRTGKPPAVITFDDGDIGLFRYLIPFLKETHIPVTVFVSTRQIETGQPYWFDRVMNLLETPEPVQLELPDLGKWKFSSNSGPVRWRVLGQLMEAMKTLSPDRREFCARMVEEQVPRRDDTQLPKLRPMSISQVKELAECPGVTIGAHSHCHNLLDQITLDQARKSVVESRRLLQNWTGKEVRHFAYPNGNYTHELRSMVRDLGFASAVTLDNLQSAPGSDRFALSRIGIGRYDPLWRFKMRLIGI